MTGDASHESTVRVLRGIALVLVVGLLAFKIVICFAGADYDGDAYAHAMAGRIISMEPFNANAHWVWLPLLHVVYAGLCRFGGGIAEMRLANAFISAASPLVLARGLGRHFERAGAGAEPFRSLPWLAAALLAIDPLCLWSSTTGQTEPPFQLLILAAMFAIANESYVLAGAAFAAGVLTRYEAWGLLPLLFWIAVRIRPFKLRAHFVYLLPAAAVLAWCWFHYRATGEPLQFLRLNKEFVHGYFAGVGYPWGKERFLPLMALWYVTVIPFVHMLGPAYPLAVLSLKSGVRALPRPFVVISAALVAIVTFGFVSGSHLGLGRHAVVLSPFYAALAGAGAIILANYLAPRLGGKGRATTVVACAVLGLVIVTRALPRSLSLYYTTKSAFAEEAAAAKALTNLWREGETIFCEDGKIEVISELPPRAFTRWQLPDTTQYNVDGAAGLTGSSLVVGKRARVSHLAGGTELWSGGSLVILRFYASAPQR